MQGKRLHRGRAPAVLALLGCVHCSTAEPPTDQDASGGSGGSADDDGVGGDPLPASGGTSASGGSSGSGASAGSGGSLGGAGGSEAPGSGGGGVPVAGDVCAFSVEHAQSSAIGTVTIVNWSTDLGALTEAHIEFGPVGGDWKWSAPVNLDLAGYRTLLLGMKTEHDYRFRIVASSASATCTSAELAVTTGTQRQGENLNFPTFPKLEEQSGGALGFYITVPGIAGSVVVPGMPAAYVFDTDGDVVWWTPETAERISDAELSWDGQSMWYVGANGGPLVKISMDGLTTESFTPGGHHDVVALPEGGVATFSTIDGEQALIEVADDGTLRAAIPLADLYTLDAYHPNALVYYPSDDTFTISDLELEGFVKLTRTGEVIWQLGGANPLGDSFELVGLTHAGGHGHDLGPAGQFLFLDNFSEDSSRVVEVVLDEDAWTATKTWEYDLGSVCMYLGGTQRLPNGNTSVVHSMAGTISEVNPAGEVVRTFTAASDQTTFSTVGYAPFRPTLHGPPASNWP